MNRASLSGLVVLNVVLVMTLAWLSFSPQPADAQIGGAGGNYIMIGGNTPGQTSDTVYIVDVASSAIMAVAYTQGARNLEVLGARNIAPDFQRSVQRR